MRQAPELTRRAIIGAVAGVAAGPARAAAKGGELVFAQEATVPTLDMHFSSANSTRNIAMSMYEMLVARDENNAPVGDLAESWQESADGLSYTFKIRPDVRFHNGQALTAADVLASWQRFARIGLQKRLLSGVAEMTAPDSATFVVKLKQKQPIFIESVSSFAVPITIHPADQAGREGGKLDPIGTGPFEFVEFVPDSHVVLRRFEGYVPNTAFPGTNGLAGRKVVTLDSVRFRFVTDGGARVAGLESGQYHVLEDVPTKSADRLKSNQAVRVLPLQHFWLQCAWINHSRPPTDNLGVRRAIQATLDMEAIMAIATDGAYDLQPSFQFPGTPYYTEAGKEYYNIADPERGKAELKSANYSGQELVLVTNNAYANMYNAAVVVAEQLRAIGMKVRMDVFDWATAIARRADNNSWNMWFTGQGTGPGVGPYTALVELVSPNPIQVTPDPTLDDIFAKLLNGASEAERKAAFAQFQTRVYENVDFMKFGDLTKVQAARSSVQGYTPYRVPRLWNVSLG